MMSLSKITRCKSRNRTGIVPAVVLAIVLGMLTVPAALAGQVYKLRVDGLACPFCAYGIEKKLKAVPGVASLKFQINKGLVVVTMKDGATLSRQQAQQIVRDAGFALRGFTRG